MIDETLVEQLEAVIQVFIDEDSCRPEVVFGNIALMREVEEDILGL